MKEPGPFLARDEIRFKPKQEALRRDTGRPRDQRVSSAILDAADSSIEPPEQGPRRKPESGGSRQASHAESARNRAMAPQEMASPLDDTSQRSMVRHTAPADDSQLLSAFERVDGDLPYKLGDYRFSTEQALRFSRGRHYVKESGSALNPLNWPAFARYLFTGMPQRTVGLRPLLRESHVHNVGFVIDGFGEAANAIQGSGIARQLAAVFQAFLFYPLILPLVNMGATGARNEMAEAKEEYLESAEELGRQKRLLIQKMGALLPAMAERLNAAGSDAALCRLLTDGLKQILARRRPHDEADLVECLRRLACYKAALDAHWLLRLKTHATPAAVAGTHAMLASVLFYEGGALANLATGGGAQNTVGAAAVSTDAGAAGFTISTGGQGAAAALNLTGHLVMAAGQLAMAVYAGIETAGAIKKHRMLETVRLTVAGSTLIDPATKKDLLAQLSRQKTLNLIGKILGNLFLFVGQMLMLFGGPLIGFGLPLLILGALLTIAAIVVKIAIQKLHESDFSFDPAAFDSSMILAAASLEEAAAIVDEDRQRSMTRMGWLGILGALEQIRSRHPHKPVEEKFALLAAAIDSLHHRSHERQLHALMLALFSDTENRSLLETCLEDDTPALTSYASLLLTAGDAQPPVGDIRDRLAAYVRADRPRRMRLMLDMAREARIDGELLQRLVTQLVVGKHGRSNPNGSRYKPYLRAEKIVEKRNWLWNKTKTVYSFEIDAFCEGMERPDQSGLHEDMENRIHHALRKVLAKGHAYQLRSRLYGANDMLMALSSAQALRQALQAPAQNEYEPVLSYPVANTSLA